MSTMTSERRLTVRQIAEELDVTERTVLNWLRAGRLRGYRLGGPKAGWRIDASDLERFIAERKGEAAVATGPEDEA